MQSCQDQDCKSVDRDNYVGIVKVLGGLVHDLVTQ
jgi:hypothetical protein